MNLQTEKNRSVNRKDVVAQFSVCFFSKRTVYKCIGCMDGCRHLHQHTFKVGRTSSHSFWLLAFSILSSQKGCIRCITTTTNPPSELGPPLDFLHIITTPMLIPINYHIPGNIVNGMEVLLKLGDNSGSSKSIIRISAGRRKKHTNHDEKPWLRCQRLVKSLQ